MGDVASHELVNTDPIISDHYRQFKESMTMEQIARLNEQYQFARQNYGEKRDFDEWSEMSGMPGWFRGYAFDQWEHPEEMYTQDQIKRFDEMMEYLKRPQ